MAEKICPIRFQCPSGIHCSSDTKNLCQQHRLSWRFNARAALVRLRRIHSSSDLYSKGTNAKSFAKFQCPNGIPTVATPAVRVAFSGRLCPVAALLSAGMANPLLQGRPDRAAEAEITSGDHRSARRGMANLPAFPPPRSVRHCGQTFTPLPASLRSAPGSGPCLASSPPPCRSSRRSAPARLGPLSPRVPSTRA